MTSKEVARRQSNKPAPASKPGPLRWRTAQDIVQLEVDDLEHETAESLIARGAAYTREVLRIEKASTILMQNTATVLIALRKKMGDWKGETHQYRVLVSEMYLAAGVPSDAEGDRTKAAIRYHVGNGLRRYLTPRELKSAGLRLESPLERRQDIRATEAAIVRATRTVERAEVLPEQASKETKRRPPKGKVRADVVAAADIGRQVKASADQLRLMEVAARLVEQLHTGTIDLHMTDGQRAKLDEHLAAIESRVRSVRRHLKKSSSDA